MNKPRKIKASVYRYDPSVDEEPRYETYEIPIVQGTSVYNVLEYISEHYDGGLAYYISCKRGACMGCTLRVNGKVRRSCTELVTGDITLEPTDKTKVIKDLVVSSKETGSAKVADTKM